MARPDAARDRGLLEKELEARRDLAPRPSLERAIWQLVLGESDEGLRTLQATYADPSAKATPTQRANIALLIGDTEGAAREARTALDVPTETWVSGWREWRTGTLALIARDDGAAVRNVDAFRAYAEDHERLRSGPASTVLDIPAGILADDAERVRSGLDALLEWHLRSTRAPSERFNSSSAAICLDAVIGLLLAHQRGLTVPVGAKYRWAEIPMLAILISEWDGRPVEHGERLTLETDLVAGPWLAARGLALPEVQKPSSVRGGKRAAPRPSVGKVELEPAIVSEHLRGLLARGLGTVWQLMSWALMAGDLDEARRQLRAGLEKARKEWEGTKPVNQNYVREHFALALAAGDGGAIDETGRLLRVWMDAYAEAETRRAPAIRAEPYGHASGHLDLLADLLGRAGGLRAEVRTVLGPVGIHAACLGLHSRDGAMLDQGLASILEEHVRQLERRTSPPPALCAPAIHLAAAARRIGVPYTVDPAFSSYPAPMIIRDASAPKGRLGRLPTDLMGTELFARGA